MGGHEESQRILHCTEYSTDTNSFQLVADASEAARSYFNKQLETVEMESGNGKWKWSNHHKCT